MKRTPRAIEVSCLDDSCIPSRVASDAQVREARLDVRAQWMLAYIDGRSALGDVLAKAGLPFHEAREGVSDLVSRGIVSLRVTRRKESWGARNARTG
jgi:hypothetical protein